LQNIKYCQVVLHLVIRWCREKWSMRCINVQLYLFSFFLFHVNISEMRRCPNLSF